MVACDQEEALLRGLAQGAVLEMTELSPIPLSILIRTLNEADRIDATLRAAKQLGGEIVVIDAASTDKTAEICRQHGARVITNPWPGFGPQRNFGERQCSNDFIFSLDADEIVTSEMAAEIRAHFVDGTPPRLMIVRKAVVFPHRKTPTWWAFCHEQVLIYDRRIATTGPNPNWDKLDISVVDTPVKVRAPLWHYSFRDWHHMLGKANYVARLAADTQPTRGRLPLVLRVIIELPLTFLKFYILRRYFLGGIDGFTTAMLTAVGRFARVAMMLERKDHADTMGPPKSGA
jgi:glycosyltransferase involved in cell wall biosynthesis